MSLIDKELGEYKQESASDFVLAYLEYFFEEKDLRNQSMFASKRYRLLRDNAQGIGKESHQVLYETFLYLDILCRDFDNSDKLRVKNEDVGEGTDNVKLQEQGIRNLVSILPIWLVESFEEN